ncbi:deoxyribose-phosphate aldolase [Bdellovibrio sp. HCB337]|uniref:deoxyribose-phosphate aldolase n=1 Tax=Bdellovibrio sp. HCB337 TaxID=3394358 RepID=UPI0039A6B9B4
MKNLASYIDHTILKPETTESQIRQLCKEALENRFFSVCVNTSFVPLCKELLKGSSVKVCAVVGFPLGAMSTPAKAFETKWAVENGADEIDMVIQIGALKSYQYDYVRTDIQKVVEAAQGRTVKVIIETSLLNHDEKIMACQLSKDAKAHFVKTSTGFNGGGATVEDVQLMKSVVGDALQVKASGGVRDQATAEAMIRAGATRLGTSSGVQLVKNQTATSGY